jgi:putative tricarboxylic transport membrane protein
MLRRLWRDDAARTDLGLAAFVLLLAITVLVAAGYMPAPFFDPLGPAAVPRLIGRILAVLALALILRRLWLAHRVVPAQRRPPDPDVFRPAPWVAAGSIVAVILYAAVMQMGLLGFQEASVLVVMALGALLSIGGRQRWASLVLLGLATGIGFNLLFTRVFFVDLPQLF